MQRQKSPFCYKKTGSTDGWRRITRGSVNEFVVADLTPTCEVRSSTSYRYDLLQQIEQAPELIADLAAAIWRSPEAFDMKVGPGGRLHLRWRALAESSGIATLSDPTSCLSVSLVCGGLNIEAEQIALSAFHSHILRKLHDTQYEASFAVLQIKQRPLLATLGLAAPKEASDHTIFALADRCFAAAYFRRLGLV